MRRCPCIGLLLAIMASSAVRAAETPPSEEIQIGLSTDTIAITSNFSGSALTIFGSLEGADPLIQRQGRYDLIVVLEGPEAGQVVRRKNRVFGMWVNTASASFDRAPLSYISASTRDLQDITSNENFAKLSLGINALKLDSNPDKTAIAGEFSEAFKSIKTRAQVYSESSGNVEFISESLFRATLQLPASIPIGHHRARAFLFRNGEFIRESSSDLAIIKSGAEQAIYDTARQDSVWYGFGSIFIAVAIGWLGNAVFRKG